MLLRQKECGNTPTEEEGRKDTHQGHEKRREPNLAHLREIRFQSHFEEEKDHPDLGEQGDQFLILEEIQTVKADQGEVPDKHADDQLPEHGRLMEPLEQLAAELRSDEDDDQGQQNAPHDLMMICRRRFSPEGCGEKQKGGDTAPQNPPHKGKMYLTVSDHARTTPPSSHDPWGKQSTDIRADAKTFEAMRAQLPSP
jgi:hypothetical protein